MATILGYSVWANTTSKYKLGMNRKPEDVPDIHETSGHHEEDPTPWSAHVASGELCTPESLLAIQTGTARSLFKKTLKVSMIGISRKDEYCYRVSRKGTSANVFENRFGNWVCISREDWPPHFSGSRRKAASALFWHNLSAISMYLRTGSAVSPTDHT